MERELENVLKFDFYSEKMIAYNDISIMTLNHLLQFRAFKLISEDMFNKYWDFFGSFYKDLMTQNQEIVRKWTNLMNQIFDTMVDGDQRHVYGDYITDSKVEQFNEDMELFESGCETFYNMLNQLIDELALAKMYATDSALLSALESEFNTIHHILEQLEEAFESFESTITGDLDD